MQEKRKFIFKIEFAPLRYTVSAVLHSLCATLGVLPVAVYMFSYALLGVATLAAIYYLIKHDDKVLSAIDNLLGGGLALFTVGMLTGALWAKQAWGEYWSWDAKESWAAATWLLYLLAIHLRGFGKVDRRVVCAVIVIAFLSLQMCWYGVNYLPSAAESVHVYNR